MNIISGLLAKLFDTLKFADSPLIDYFNDGITIPDIDNILIGVNLDFPKEFYELYMWKNGIDLKKAQDARIDIDLIPFGVFTSLQHSIEMYNIGKGNYWSANLFPLLDSIIGEIFLIDCDKKSPTYKMIFFYSISILDFDTIITAFDTIESFLKTAIEAYEKQVVFYASSETDECFKIYNQIGEKYNPNSRLWRIYKENP
jgi:hypothetical protein